MERFLKKTLGKGWFAAFMAAVLILCTITPAFAVTGEKDKLIVTVTTDKETYSAGDEVQLLVKAKNTGKEAVENVKIKVSQLPEGIKLAKGASDTITLGDVAVNAEVSGTVKAVAEKSVVSSDKTIAGNVKTGDSANGAYFMAAVLAAAVLVIVIRKNKKAAGTIVMIALFLGALFTSSIYAAGPSGRFEIKVPVKVDKKDAEIIVLVTYGKESESGTNVVEKPSTGEDATKPPSGEDNTEKPNPPSQEEVYGRVSVHDPSIVKDEKTGLYYIFGSHMAWAKSKDLTSWTMIRNNINSDYETLFAKEAAWAALGGSQGSQSGRYEVSGNLWAPDVIWNETMGKWCMYMSVNGDSWYTSIALLTSDSLEGPWEYQGTVVYSGFTNAAEAAKTDFAKVTGTNDVPARYLENRNGNRTYGMNAIDPCVKYDEKGNLWMAYGSWFGGIYMLKLDPQTGLRDYAYKYETKANESDEYQGIKLAGGAHVSGEAAYLEKIGDYWYLFLSYGGLTAGGGYNMRVFRSENITGPFVDESGDSAKYTAGTDNINGKVGIKLFGNYKWNTMNVGQVAQGHNSVLVDSDGKAYVVYHTRFADGTEGHQVRVHQLFANQDGWLVAAPYEYAGETISKTGYSMEEMAGSYEVIFHTQEVDYRALACNTAKDIALNEDGTVTGDYTGTWESEKDSSYVTLTLNGHVYKGVFVKQQVEETSQETMCFAVLGDDEVEVWGSKYLSGKTAVDLTIKNGVIKLPAQTVKDISFQKTGLQGTTVSYTSANQEVLTNDGKVTRGSEDIDVIVTATFSKGDYSVDKEYTIKVLGDKGENERLLVGQYYTNGAADLSKAVEGTYQFPNPFNKTVTNGLEIAGGATIEFDVEGTGEYLSTILSFFGGGRMYFTGGSYLGYNATGEFFDANVKNSEPWAAGTDFINGKAHMEIKLTGSGFEVYANGKLAYDSKQLAAGTIPGGKELTSYYNVIQWLNNTAETINFGWGSWWADKFNGKISNVKLYVEPMEVIDTTGYVYYQDYRIGGTSEWKSANVASAMTIQNDGDDRGNYFKLVSGGDSGNRGAYAAFNKESEISGKYTISVDTSLTAGVLTQRSESAFAILGTDAEGYTANSAVTKGYILKLYNQPPAGASANQTDTSLQDTWKINDTEQTVKIPVNTWVTIKADVDTNAGKANVTISRIDNGAELFAGEVAINGNGALSGLQILRGRGVGTASVDNIKVQMNESEPDDTPEELIKPIYLYDFASGLSSTGTITGEATTATIVGNGKLAEDSERGQVFDNSTGVKAEIRKNYLSLPKEIGSTISGLNSKAFTIAMWIKSPESNNSAAEPYGFHSPLFTMKDAEGATTWPIVNIALKGSSQVNWAGYIDNNANTDIAYIADNKWHYVAATFSQAGTTVYVDGNITNTANNTDANTCMGIFGADEGIWDSVNIGGNQAWAWEDVDAHLYYDDISIYDVALSKEEISALMHK